MNKALELMRSQIAPLTLLAEVTEQATRERRKKNPSPLVYSLLVKEMNSLIAKLAQQLREVDRD